MATRKQRRRREKEHRHEYEIVYVDGEGNEVEPDEAEIRAPAKKVSSSGKSSSGSRASGRRGRVPQEPSWRRVAKRGALFAPIFTATILVIDSKHRSLSQAVVTTVFLVAFFVPFSYMLDSFMWRSYQRKQGQGTSSKR